MRRETFLGVSKQSFFTYTTIFVLAVELTLFLIFSIYLVVIETNTSNEYKFFFRPDATFWNGTTYLD